MEDLDTRGDLYAKGFIVIPTPEEIHACNPIKAHRDSFKKPHPLMEGQFLEVDPIPGMIWQCPDCGLYWVVRRHDYGAGWYRMRWYHRESKIIKRLRNGK